MILGQQKTTTDEDEGRVSHLMLPLVDCDSEHMIDRRGLIKTPDNNNIPPPPLNVPAEYHLLNRAPLADRWLTFVILCVNCSAKKHE